MLDKLIRRYKNALLFLTVIVLMFLLLRGFYSFYQSRVESLNKDISDLAKMKTVAVKLQDQEIKVKDIKSKYFFQDSFSLISMLHRYAGITDVEIVSVTPSAGRPLGESNRLSSTVLDLTLEAGMFKRLTDFLRSLDNEEKKIIISSMQIQGNDKTIRVNMKIVGLVSKPL